MTTLVKEDNAIRVFCDVYSGKQDPSVALENLSEDNYIDVLLPHFNLAGQEQMIGCGEGILPGDVTGQLVLNRELGNFLVEEAERRGTKISIIYSIPFGDLEDFQIIQNCKGFFTNQHGRTTFCPVQASCEGIPSIVGVDCSYVNHMDTSMLTFTFHDRSKVVINQPTRSVLFDLGIRVFEGDHISIRGRSGELFADELEIEEPLIARIYRTVTETFMESIQTFGPENADFHLGDTRTFQSNQEWLIKAIKSSEFQGFQKLVRCAQELVELKVYSTAHTRKGMAQTRVLSSEIWIDKNNQMRMDSNPLTYGLGLLRDERMWGTQDKIDLQRLILLGPDIVGNKFDEYKKEYLRTFVTMLYDTFQVGTGEVAVVRLLCVPYKMLFPNTFNAVNFAEKFGLDPSLVESRAKVLGGEGETYHGCRGLRVTVQREDICELWCEGVLRAAQMAHAAGSLKNLQILLSMVTFPQEVEMFLRCFELKMEEMGLTVSCPWIQGISVMIETSGVFHLLEDIMNLRGESVEINGALFGGNDFTAACLNMNRSDSGTLIIPNYIRLGIMGSNPFQSINTQIVGKTIVQGLRRIRFLKRENKRSYLLGLGGEIAGDWKSIQWLARHAAAYGLNYVTTSPERILFALFASAQTVIDAY